MRKIFMFILLIAFFFTFIGTSKKVTALIYTDSLGNYYFDYESKLDEAYYDGLDALEGESFRSRLHEIIASNTRKYSYDECYSLLETIDEDPNNSQNILCLLTNKSMPKNMHGSSTTYYWNREHIWAKAHGFNGQIDSRPWNDLNHLRAVEGYTNSTYHNDRNYDYVLTDVMREDLYGNRYNSLYYEPRDGAKGDIARMLLYMSIRYNGDELSDGYKLVLSNDEELITKASLTTSKEGAVGKLDTLLEWAYLDPVDDLERSRNDKVYEIQGNRNPFIDHPEYINKLYDVKMTFKGDDEFNVRYYVTDGEFNYFDSTNYKKGSLINLPNVTPTANDKLMEFEGWYLDAAMTQKFAFNTPVDTDICLYAKFVAKAHDPFNALEESLPLAKLSYQYDVIECSEDTPVYETASFIPSKTEGGSFNAKKNTDKNFDAYLAYDTNLFTFTYHTNNKASSYCGKGYLKLYAGGMNGTSFDIVANDASITIIDISLEGKNETKPELNILENDFLKITKTDQIVTVQNIINETKGNAIALSNITVTYYRNDVKKAYAFKDITLSFGYIISNYDYANLPTIHFMLNGVDYDYTVLTYDANYKLLSFDIKVSDLNACYKACFYVLDKKTTSQERIISVKELAKCYLAMVDTNQVVASNLDTLIHLAN